MFQPLFIRFHEQIQLRNYDENAELAQMMNGVLEVLREGLRAVGRPGCEHFPQGSYAMGTGIKPPPGGDYDIDVGVSFRLEHARYKPLEVKGWVHEALCRRSDLGQVTWRRACVTVQRSRFHMDIPVFAKEGERLYLALGKEHGAAQGSWQEDERMRFIAEVRDRHRAIPEQHLQFRRVVRLLKRWKDRHFPRDGVSPPTGLALTVMAYKWYQPRREGSAYDDLGALETLLSNVLGHFQGDVLDLRFPFAPRDPVLWRMSPEQVRQLKVRLVQLQKWLGEARAQHAIGPLRRAFGDEFPVP